MAGKQVSYRVEKSNHPLKLAVTDIPTPQDKQILVKITVTQTQHLPILHFPAITVSVPSPFSLPFPPSLPLLQHCGVCHSDVHFQEG